VAFTVARCVAELDGDIQLIERIIIMELFAKIELDPGELWEEEIKENVDELLQEEIPGYFCEIEDRAEWLEEKFGELNYRTDELESHTTEDHEARITEVEERLSDLSEELDNIKQLIPREVILNVVRELLAEARITL
jgi:polyhydroxyalkanoate synthesis regulator phasin